MWSEQARPSLLTALAIPLLLSLPLACKSREAPPKPPPTQPEAPPALELKGDKESLIFSYSEDSGRTFKTAAKIEDIPEAARSSVVVTDLSLSPEKRQAAKYVYLADLSQKRADGSYPVAVASRYGFEAKAAAGAPASAEGGSGGVVVYSTAWCGVCKKAKRLLKTWGVPFEEKDIEASASAQRELAAKAQRQGMNPSGVPVIDVAGTLLQGLDEQTLKALLSQKGLL